MRRFRVAASYFEPGTSESITASIAPNLLTVQRYRKVRRSRPIALPVLFCVTSNEMPVRLPRCLKGGIITSGIRLR